MKMLDVQQIAALPAQLRVLEQEAITQGIQVSHAVDRRMGIRSESFR